MGVNSVLMRVRMGTDTMAKPTPTVPWRAAAAAVITSAIISSSGLNKVLPGCGPAVWQRERALLNQPSDRYARRHAQPDCLRANRSRFFRRRP